MNLKMGTCLGSNISSSHPLTLPKLQNFHPQEIPKSKHGNPSSPKPMLCIIKTYTNREMGASKHKETNKEGDLTSRSPNEEEKVQ